MKKYIVKTAVVVLVLILLTSCLASCSKLHGAYTSQLEDEINTTYIFSMFSDKIIISYFDRVEVEGTYEIEDDKIYITVLGDRAEHTYSKEGGTIYIDGVAYVKE